MARSEQQNLAAKFPGREGLQHLAGLDPATRRQAEEKEFGLRFVEYDVQPVGLSALASDETHLLQGLSQEGSNMRLAVYDAYARSDLSPVERDRLCWLSGLLMFHVATFRTRNSGKGAPENRGNIGGQEI
jgi:hypothetical protein